MNRKGKFCCAKMAHLKSAGFIDERPCAIFYSSSEFGEGWNKSFCTYIDFCPSCGKVQVLKRERDKRR